MWERLIIPPTLSTSLWNAVIHLADGPLEMSSLHMPSRLESVFNSSWTNCFALALVVGWSSVCLYLYLVCLYTCIVYRNVYGVKPDKCCRERAF